VLQVLRNRVALALKSGPGAVRRWFSCFDMDGNNEVRAARGLRARRPGPPPDEPCRRGVSPEAGAQVDERELRELLVDFGLHLSARQVAELMSRIDLNGNGRIDQVLERARPQQPRRAPPRASGRAPEARAGTGRVRRGAAAL
jgi:hypothetical protein